MFKDFEMELGGKTGSAETGKGVNAWFVGFAPFDDPEIAVVTLIENGEHGSYCAYVARDIMQEYFKLGEVEEENVEAASYNEQQN